MDCTLTSNISIAQTTNSDSSGVTRNISAGRRSEGEYQTKFSYGNPLPYADLGKKSQPIQWRRCGTSFAARVRKENAVRFRQMIIKKQLETCPNTPLCTYNATTSMETGSCCQSCSCNITTCADTRDCCADIIDDVYFDINEDISVSSKQCIPFKYGLKYTGNGKFGITSCPLHVKDTHTRLCKRKYSENVSLQDLTPVYDNKTFTIYRNKYCAYCHGLDGNMFAYFDPNLRCNDLSGVNSNASDMLSTVLENEDCNIEFFTNETRYDFELGNCLPLIHDCNVTGNWKLYDAEIERACQIYKSPVEPWNGVMIPLLGYTTRFQNIFCLLCNGFSETYTRSTCFKYNPYLRFGGGLSLLFNVRKTASSTHPPVVRHGACF
ncbi:hypothetical protein DPMN_031406 [Dreissena polymorpha]|uniref:Uncharacterized protein n=1 Tax=Dreissena polymorpha TaxID=45954 RepID=A0A9D4LZY1_DREPO|nr:hypothetical protein DPMN_031406 [Dreissena polymorpha]